MPDMNAEFHTCCGHDVEISGSPAVLPDGRAGRRVWCGSCRGAFDVPGGLEDARRAVPDHFRSEHQLTGRLEDYQP
jgi:hypothetical protein